MDAAGEGFWYSCGWGFFLRITRVRLLPAARSPTHGTASPPTASQPSSPRSGKPIKGPSVTPSIGTVPLPLAATGSSTQQPSTASAAPGTQAGSQARAGTGLTQPQQQSQPQAPLAFDPETAVRVLRGAGYPRHALAVAQAARQVGGCCCLVM